MEPDNETPSSNTADSPRFAYQIKITINGTNPAIWRSVVVPDTYTFWDLHVTIQDALDWGSSWLHLFSVYHPDIDAWVTIGPVELDANGEVIPEFEFVHYVEWGERVKDWFYPRGEPALYRYGPGGAWELTVELQEICPVDPSEKFPRLVEGTRVSPPDSLAGPGEWYAMLDGKRPLADEYEGWELADIDPADWDPSLAAFRDPRKFMATVYGPGVEARARDMVSVSGFPVFPDPPVDFADWAGLPERPTTGDLVRFFREQGDQRKSDKPRDAWDTQEDALDRELDEIEGDFEEGDEETGEVDETLDAETEAFGEDNEDLSEEYEDLDPEDDEISELFDRLGREDLSFADALPLVKDYLARTGRTGGDPDVPVDDEFLFQETLQLINTLEPLPAGQPFLPTDQFQFRPKIRIPVKQYLRVIANIEADPAKLARFRVPFLTAADHMTNPEAQQLATIIEGYVEEEVYLTKALGLCRQLGKLERRNPYVEYLVSTVRRDQGQDRDSILALKRAIELAGDDDPPGVFYFDIALAMQMGGFFWSGYVLKLRLLTPAFFPHDVDLLISTAFDAYQLRRPFKAYLVAAAREDPGRVSGFLETYFVPQLFRPEDSLLSTGYTEETLAALESTVRSAHGVHEEFTLTESFKPTGRTGLDLDQGSMGHIPAGVNPHLHESLLSVVKNQIREGNPPEAGEAFERLLCRGASRDQALRKIAEALATEFWTVLQTNQPYDAARYTRALREL